MRLNELKININNVINNIECEIIKFSSKIDVEKEKKIIEASKIEDIYIEYEREETFKCYIGEEYIFFSLKDKEKYMELMSFKRSKYKTLGEIISIDFENNVMLIDLYAFNRSIFVRDIKLVATDKVELKNIDINEIKLPDKTQKIIDFITASESKFYPYFLSESYLYIQYGKNMCIVCRRFDENEFVIEKVDKINEIMKENDQKVDFKYSISEGIVFLLSHREFEKEKISKTLSDHKGYLDIWDKYSEEEGEIILDRAREIGIIEKSKKITQDAAGVVMILKKANDSLTLNDKLSFSDTKPIYLENREMNWIEYIEYRKQLEKEKNLPEVMDCSILNINGNEITIEVYGDINKFQYCFLSIRGSENSSRRRLEARERIKKGESANPNIGMIIEGKNKIGIEIEEKIKEIEPLSPFVMQKVFKNYPTPVQIEAIRIALNTPDIAVIQGPPGTGKTTVITAIIERLNELTNKNKDNKGAVLITSFQHDAVTNVIERLRINSLPTIKYGRKDENDYRNENNISKWCDELEEKIVNLNPKVKDTPEIMILNDFFNKYILFPSVDSEFNLLAAMKKINCDFTLETKINDLLENIEIEKNELDKEILPLIRALRTNKKSFLDDGKINAKNLYYKLKSILNFDNLKNKEILEYLKVAKNIENISDEFILESIKIKNKLLEIFIPKPFYSVYKPKIEIKNIYEEIKRNNNKPLDEADNIIYDLLNELRNNKEKIINTLENYEYVYAATTQQSMGTEIKKAKSANSKKITFPIYEVVIVDEAARVNPLDLMIPLSQAEKKIILVGDHRQLPHIYDEEIFEATKSNDENLRETQEKHIKESMFQYLKDKAEELEKNDGIKRTITLDRQYRMHPLIGNFVSDNFYKKNNEEFSSPLNESFFKQNFYDKPIVWIDVKHKMGDKKRVGTSWIREIEARIIAKELKKLYESEEGKKYSYGVITFYSSQVKKIQEEIRKLDPYLLNIVKVGSVDAFQGMEFDVMFLSIVRTDKSDIAIDEKKDYYGFLTYENRLCVALSRQKKLLIIVGNSDIFVNNYEKIAREKIPAMNNLYHLCESGEGIILNGDSI